MQKCSICILFQQHLETFHFHPSTGSQAMNIFRRWKTCNSYNFQML